MDPLCQPSIEHCTDPRAPLCQFCVEEEVCGRPARHFIDFNQDGAPDFFPEFRDNPLTQDQPLIGAKPRLMATRRGYSFITLQNFGASGGQRVTGLLASQP